MKASQDRSSAGRALYLASASTAGSVSLAFSVLGVLQWSDVKPMAESAPLIFITSDQRPPRRALSQYTPPYTPLGCFAPSASQGDAVGDAASPAHTLPCCGGIQPFGPAQVPALLSVGSSGREEFVLPVGQVYVCRVPACLKPATQRRVQLLFAPTAWHARAS